MSKTYLIAEMACSHEGKIDLAKKIITSAGEANADAIQFQIWQAKNIMSPQHKSFGVLKRIELTYEKWRELYNFSKMNYPCMDVIACVYDIDSINFCMDLDVDAYKIHCSDITNPIVIKTVASTQKRIDLSIGGSNADEIQQCIEWIKEISNADIWLMYGLQHFPTPIDDICLEYMRNISKYYKLPIGYQDHSDPVDPAAFWLPAAAISSGIKIIEKHLTHDRSFKGVDHEAALNPDEFLRFAKMIRGLDTSNVPMIFPRELSESEKKYRAYSRKSIVLANDLPAGRKIVRNDLLFLRSDEMGIAPVCIQEVIGRELNRPLKAYAVLTEEVLL